jgi:hypothetical protein
MTTTTTATTAASGHCPHCGSDWREPFVDTFDGGPMEGDWEVSACSGCNAFELSPVTGGHGLANVLAALKAAGCEPEPGDGRREAERA